MGILMWRDNNLARVREIAAVAIIEAAAKQRLVRYDKRNQIASLDRPDHQTGDLGDLWYDLFSNDIRDGEVQRK